MKNKDIKFYSVRSNTTKKEYLIKNGYEDGERGILLYEQDVFGNKNYLGFRSEWYADEVCEHNIDDLVKVVD